MCQCMSRKQYDLVTMQKKNTKKTTKYMYTMQIFLLLGFGEGGEFCFVKTCMECVPSSDALWRNSCKSWVLQMGL